MGLVETWRQIIVGGEKSWVLFRHGTCVILMEREADLAEQARTLIKKWGPVQAGSPAGDFSVVDLAQSPGWVVAGHHPDILTYVAPEEVDADASDLVIGLLGRSKREQDAEERNVVHVEDKRPGSL